MDGWMVERVSLCHILFGNNGSKGTLDNNKKENIYIYICEPQKRNLIKINWDRRIHIGQILKQLLLLLL